MLNPGEKYIKGYDTLDNDTRMMYDYEASWCDKVLSTFEEGYCECGSRRFKIGNVIVDFSFPFVHSYRVQTLSMRKGDAGNVICTNCEKTVSVS